MQSLLVIALALSGPALATFKTGRPSPQQAGDGGGSGSAPASKVAFGEIITNCTVPNSFALTFDDGPHEFTSKLIDTLNAAKLKGTFFVNGDNFSNLTDRKTELQAMLAGGHQIGSHTFTHADLSNITEGEVVMELTRLDCTMFDLVGMMPTYLRPPFFAMNDVSLGVAKRLEYHVVNADIDTKDFENNEPKTNDKSFETYKELFKQGGSISLMHDVHNTTVNQLIPNVVNFLQSEGMGRKSLTVGECLGDAPANWYRTRSGASKGTGMKEAPPPIQGPMLKPRQEPRAPGTGCGCGEALAKMRRRRAGV